MFATGRAQARDKLGFKAHAAKWTLLHAMEDRWDTTARCSCGACVRVGSPRRGLDKRQGSTEISRIWRARYPELEIVRLY